MRTYTHKYLQIYIHTYINRCQSNCIAHARMRSLNSVATNLRSRLSVSTNRSRYLYLPYLYPFTRAYLKPNLPAL
jgi:hypothetical protein